MTTTCANQKTAQTEGLWHNTYSVLCGGENRGTAQCASIQHHNIEVWHLIALHASTSAATDTIPLLSLLMLVVNATELIVQVDKSAQPTL